MHSSWLSTVRCSGCLMGRCLGVSAQGLSACLPGALLGGRLPRGLYTPLPVDRILGTLRLRTVNIV